MNEYLFLLRGGNPTTSKTEAERNTEIWAWASYMVGLVESESLVGGLPLVPGRIVVSASGVVAEPPASATDGIIGGYLIVKADSIGGAAELAKDCPHIANEGNIEVREISPLPIM